MTTGHGPWKYCRKRVYFWVPELMYGGRVKHVPCPDCGYVAGNVVRKCWNESGPRLVCGYGRDYYILCKEYYCNKCERKFQGYDSKVLAQLPATVQQRFPAVIYPKACLDKGLINTLVIRISKKQSFQDFQKELEEIKYCATSICYFKVIIHL